MRSFHAVWIVLCLGSLAVAQPRGGSLPAGMTRVEGKYHTLLHDLTPEEAHEVLVRMEAMVDEYMVRTREFSGKLNQKMPFMIFRKAEDYYRAGGPAGSAGVFMPGRALMAIAGEKLTTGTWHVIQHEGFHQFADAVIGRNLPVWVNEGLAEYFGEAVYTGSGFVSGAIPAGRLKRVKDTIEKKKFRTVEGMMLLTHQRWNSEMAINNYDQAWAMVMFLAHGEEGKYQKAFGRFIIAMNRGQMWERAWQDSFGSAQGFQEKWEAWWTSEERGATVDVYAQAATAMLTNYLARSASQKQTYETIDALVAAIDAGEVQSHKSDVLPNTLASECVSLVKSLKRSGAEFQIVATPVKNSPRLTQPAIECVLKDGTKIIGTYKLKGSRVGDIDTKVEALGQARGK